jgi:monoamine oxidase
MDKPIIIIGAGAAGLMAARELSAAGLPVTVLEAATRTGGRIHTLTAPGFEQPVELGAEFVHGRLPISFALLEEAGLGYTPTSGAMYRINGGKLQSQEGFTIDWDLLLQHLDMLTEDMTMARFLDTHFAGSQYAGLRASVQRFTEGFDVADINDVSAMALRQEWSHEDHGQYRIDGGYQRLVDWLVQQCTRLGAVIHTLCTVKTIHHAAGAVQVTTAGGQVFEGSKAVVTAPAGVLRDTGGRAAIHFTPAIGSRVEAMRNIGYGTVTKLLLQFTKAFWNGHAKNIGFVVSDQTVPTWWTQPGGSALLTGWAGGPRAAVFTEMDEAAMIQEGIGSLAGIFDKPVAAVEALLVTARAVNWGNDPYSLGAYSYDTVQTAAARRLLLEPVDNTLFFAGEALYEGASPGTVEAAFSSGKKAAEAILRGSRPEDLS